MDEYQALIQTLALAMGASWASGINLYAVLLVLGIGGATGGIELPAELEVVESPLVIGAAAVMYFVEFFADKIPGVDSGWDAIHTFIRIPAGAMLAAGAVGDVSMEWTIAAGILGGSLTASTHAAKAGSRVMINTSPEPFTNWAASFSEDAIVLAGLWAAISHPWVFLGCLVVFVLLLAWLLPRLMRGVLFLLRKIGSLLGIVERNDPSAGVTTGAEDRVGALERLDALRSSGTLTQEEFDAEKRRVLGSP